MSYLDGKHDERHKNHDDDQELWRPDLGGDVAKAHGGEGDDAEVKRVEQGQVVSRALEVLDATDADGGQREGCRQEDNWARRQRFTSPLRESVYCIRAMV